MNGIFEESHTVCNTTRDFSITWCCTAGAGIAKWYSAELLAGWSGVRVPAAAGNVSLHHRV